MQNDLSTTVYSVASASRWAMSRSMINRPFPIGPHQLELLHDFVRDGFSSTCSVTNHCKNVLVA